MSRGWTLGETILAVGTMSIVVPYAVLFAVVMWRRLRSGVAQTAPHAFEARLARPLAHRQVRDAPASDDGNATRDAAHRAITERVAKADLVGV
ncbi:MAG: hypothetical protein K8T90_22445 [Planctomycetes bacterium]|nr:hypothetical protein [Planctomycetota bacterium]